MKRWGNLLFKTCGDGKVLYAILFSLSVMAANAESAVNATKAAKSVSSQWTLSSQLSISTPAYREEGIEPQNDADFLFLPSYKINETFSASLRAEYGEDLKNRSKSEVNLVRVALGHRAIEFQDLWKIAPSLRYSFPAKQKDREEGNYKGSLSLATVLSLDSQKALLSDWGLNFGTVITKNFFVYDTDLKGASTISESLAGSLSVERKFGLLSLSLVGGYSYGATFSGENKQLFELTQEAAYSFTPQWSAMMGHTNSGSPFLDDGFSSNLQVVDEDSSRIYLGAAISL